MVQDCVHPQYLHASAEEIERRPLLRLCFGAANPGTTTPMSLLGDLRSAPGVS